MKNKTIAVFITSLLCSCFNSTPKTSNATTSTAVNKNLFEVAKEINKKCPIATDENTRMDSASVYNEFMITYHYTVHTVSNKEVDLKKFKASMETSMAEKYKTDPQLAIYRDNNIAIAYDYKDKAGDFLCYFICGN
jgi:nitrogen fixation protein FixH